ncbi:MAG: hypothetical protein V4736_06060 [Bdellovibrionota bacterium]
MKNVLFTFFAVLLVGFQAQACKNAKLASNQGIWELTQGTSCPQTLEIRCEVDPDTKNDILFVDEITDDNSPGAQIYFTNINAREIDIQADIAANEKEISTYNDRDQSVTASFKKCRLLLGCWGAYKVRHRLQFKSEQAQLQKVWGETKSCSYTRVSRQVW